LAGFVYILGTVVTLLCAFLLLRAYTRVRLRLLLWSAICFAGLTIANALVFIDIIIVPHLDLYFWRLAVAALAMVVLLFGLVWESDR
jgi:branched-subunit amino acid transport protein